MPVRHLLVSLEEFRPVDYQSTVLRSFNGPWIHFSQHVLYLGNATSFVLDHGVLFLGKRNVGVGEPKSQIKGSSLVLRGQFLPLVVHHAHHLPCLVSVDALLFDDVPDELRIELVSKFERHEWGK